ncbi:MAG: type 4a pilus biogenesis protein PilO [Candidatus Cloacimonetes bacterium]|nr:type 4a pilus biogenesis protein PilO [Candidatus Cloacimonadota bacterium]
MKQKYLIFTLVMIFVGLLFFMISGSMIGKKVSKINELDSRIKSAQEKLNSAKIMDEQLSQFSRIIENSLTSEKSFSHQEVNAFIKNLADLADQNEIAVLAIYPKELQSSINLVEQQYLLEINTTYVQFGRFLTNLEALDNIVKIKSFDVMPLSDAETGQRSKKTDKVAGPRIARYKVALELSVYKVHKES